MTFPQLLGSILQIPTSIRDYFSYNGYIDKIHNHQLNLWQITPSDDNHRKQNFIYFYWYRQMKEEYIKAQKITYNDQSGRTKLW